MPEFILKCTIISTGVPWETQHFLTFFFKNDNIILNLGKASRAKTLEGGWSGCGFVAPLCSITYCDVFSDVQIPSTLSDGLIYDTFANGSEFLYNKSLSPAKFIQSTPTV